MENKYDNSSNQMETDENEESKYFSDERITIECDNEEINTNICVQQDYKC